MVEKDPRLEKLAMDVQKSTQNEELKIQNQNQNNIEGGGKPPQHRRAHSAMEIEDQKQDSGSEETDSDDSSSSYDSEDDEDDEYGSE